MSQYIFLYLMPENHENIPNLINPLSIHISTSISLYLFAGSLNQVISDSNISVRTLTKKN